jgi:hypothetical protein
VAGTLKKRWWQKLLEWAKGQKRKGGFVLHNRKSNEDLLFE